MSDLPVRDIARALVFEPGGRVLLIAYEAVRDLDPAWPGLRRFWFLPGGGLDEGESHEAALKRELEEEIGVADAPVGPEVARFDGPFLLFRKPRYARERIFVVRLPHDQIDVSRLAETEDNPVLGVKWWGPDELAATTERVEPEGLVALVREVAAGRLSPALVRLGPVAHV